MGSVSSGGWLASLVLCGVYAHTDAATSLLVLAAGSGTGLVTWSQEPRHCSGIWQLAHHWSKGTVSIWWLWVLSGLSSAPHVLLPTTLSHRLNILLELPSVPAHKSNSSWLCFDGRARIWVPSPAYTIWHLVWFDGPATVGLNVVISVFFLATLLACLLPLLVPATLSLSFILTELSLIACPADTLVSLLPSILRCALALLALVVAKRKYVKRVQYG